MSYENLDKMTIDEDGYDDLCLKYGKARVDREIELELESKEDAFNAFMSKRNKAIKDGTLGTMGASKVLISEAVPVLSKAITRWFEKVDTGRPGKRHILAGLAKDLSSDELSFITLRTVLENAMGSVGLTSLGSKIGEAVEDEVR